MNQRPNNRPAAVSAPDHTVRLWSFENGDTALSAESAADTIPLGASRWLDDALDFIDEGYWCLDDEPLVPFGLHIS